MRLVDLPDGPAAALVRGLAACLSSVTEVPLAELPDVGTAPVEQALGAWKSWLAGRGSGLVPIADPRSFQWAGWWVAVADGPAGQVAVLAFGTPPGVVLSPQDSSLLGRATADLHISNAWVVASLNPVVTPVVAGPALSGVVEALAVAPHAEAPLRLVRSARALAGRGLEGDGSTAPACFARSSTAAAYAPTSSATGSCTRAAPSAPDRPVSAATAAGAHKVGRTGPGCSHPPRCSGWAEPQDGRVGDRRRARTAARTSAWARQIRGRGARSGSGRPVRAVLARC